MEVSVERADPATEASAPAAGSTAVLLLPPLVAMQVVGAVHPSLLPVDGRTPAVPQGGIQSALVVEGIRSNSGSTFCSPQYSPIALGERCLHPKLVGFVSWLL